ncbi:DUF6745 domain-containing protein [Kutzneria sp. NPDC052558]|uniref:DUF6745 domain-containing protein n=1 Tax=Kutzneria sp. NPDC052558 TaxID=3364121 RepID=UPI0037C9ACAE
MWSDIAQMRSDWLAHGLSTAGADRSAAEEAITGLYALLGEPPPEFVWIPSPGAIGDVLEPSPVLLRSDGPWPLESRLASLVSLMRQRLDGPLTRYEVSLVDNAVRKRLGESVRRAVAYRIREELTAGYGLHWYGQQDADWVAYYQVFHQVCGVPFARRHIEQLELWATIARSCGWWWPRDGRCVISERPLAIRTETVDNQLRLHDRAGPAVVFPDGWSVHCWHGTRVPAWAVRNPTVEAIAAERNIEIRRCAIENLGWPTYIEQAGLKLLAQAPDPGNHGSELRLYEDWSDRNRILLAVNGSVERDGTRRWYGLRVPPWLSDPVDAAGWSYGLTGAQYSRLLRRT